MQHGENILAGSDLLEFIFSVHLLLLLLLLFLPHCAAFYGIFVPQTGIKPSPPGVEAQSLKHWSARKVLIFCYYNLVCAERDALFQMFWWQFYLLK